jgi:RNA polymerase sigma factor (sigma-70 family)
METGNPTRLSDHRDQDALRSDGSQPCRSNLHQKDLDQVRRLLARDERAWLEFVREYRKLILHRIHAAAREFRLASGRSDLVEDVCAEIFALLLSNNMDSLRQYAGRSKLSTWLAVVVRRTAMRYFQRYAAGHRQSDTAEMDQIPVPCANESDEHQQHRLRTTLRRLSPADQQVLTLYYDSQQSYAQIAAALGITENAVGPKLQRARSRLKAILQHPDP